MHTLTHPGARLVVEPGRDELDAEASTAGPRRPADAAGELRAVAAEADEEPGEGA